jgi:hypothetical protein
MVRLIVRQTDKQADKRRERGRKEGREGERGILRGREEKQSEGGRTSESLRAREEKRIPINNT